MIAIIGSNELENPEDIEAAILPNGRVLIPAAQEEQDRTVLENILKTYRGSEQQLSGDEAISTSSIMEQFAMRSNNGYATKSLVWLFEDGGAGYPPTSKAKELIKAAGLK